MNRPGFERPKRRTRLRLTLEHLENRRLMAGLNVLVFADQDGSRSLNSAVDSPATNRLVYVDLNRDFQFQDGEPLAVSGLDGVARFPNLASGDYLIGLATSHASQVVTTSVVSDARGTFLKRAASESLFSTSDLRHVWSLASSGDLTPVGIGDTTRLVLHLGGPVISSTHVGALAHPLPISPQGFPSTHGFGEEPASAWLLVDRGGSQPALVSFDLRNGTTKTLSIDGIGDGNRVTGVALVGRQLVLQLDTAGNSLVATASVVGDRAQLGPRIAVPSGQIVGSSGDRLAIIGDENRGNGPVRLNTLKISDHVAQIETTHSERPVASVDFSSDGRFLLASLVGGGVQVFSTVNGLKSAAYLAEATGPVTDSARDSRLVTGNSSKPNEVIIWDPSTWNPVSRVELAAQSEPIVALAVDSYGDRLLAATSHALFGASLANATSQVVHVPTGARPAEITLGVRVVSKTAPLPTFVKIEQSSPEDSVLQIDLANHPALLGMASSRLIFTPSSGAHMGTVLVTPTGRLTYRPTANAYGSDSASVRVYDGVTSSTLVISMNIMPVNDPPSAFTIDPTALSEYADQGETAGFATIFDVDTQTNYLITISDPRFLVVNGQIVRSDVGALDFETEPSVDLEVTATDLDNPAFVLTRRISIPVLDSNDAPSQVALSATAISENSVGAKIGDMLISDPDGHGQYTYSVSDSRFEVVDGQLQLRGDQKIDYETEPHIWLTIAVSDPTAESQTKSVTTTIMIDVLDNNDAPSAISLTGAEVKSGEPGAVVGSINVVDQDVVNEYKFVVSDPRFVVEGTTLKLRDGESIDRMEETSVPVLVTVTDASGNIISQTVTVSVVNDAPFQNPTNPLDVDNDGKVYPRDVVILINELNRKGPHVIQPQSGSGEGDQDPPPLNIFIDVNGDGYLTPLDALILINHLNRREALTSDAQSRVGGEAPLELDDSDDGVRLAPTPENRPGAYTATGAAQPTVSGAFESLVPPLPSPLEINTQTRNQHEALDAELESLLEQLSRERLR